MRELLGWVTEDRRHPAAMIIDVDEAPSLDPVVPLPLDRESGVGVLDVNRFGVTVPGHPGSQMVGRIEQPRIAGFRREQDELADPNDALVVLGRAPLNVAHLVGKAKTLAVHYTLARSPGNPLATRSACPGFRHGTLHPAVRPPAGVCLSLLRPHRHSRLPDWSLAARARRPLLSQRDRRPGDQQGDPKRADPALPEVG